MAIAFTCPVHGGFCMLAVPFANPVDGGPRYPDGFWWKNNFWQRTGETFDSLTLTPSIHVKDGENGPTHWHGFITNGEVT